MTSLMTSPGHKIGQILKLIYLRQYLSCSVDQMLKMSEMLMAIFLVYSTSGLTSGKKSVSSYEKIVPNYAKKQFFIVMTLSMTSQGGLKTSLYIHV